MVIYSLLRNLIARETAEKNKRRSEAYSEKKLKPPVRLHLKITLNNFFRMVKTTRG
jgi:hypothetical protein